MKNMMRKTVLIISFFNFVMAAAQEASYRYYDATQLWRTTGNAAGGVIVDARHSTVLAVSTSPSWCGAVTRSITLVYVQLRVRPVQSVKV